MRQHAVRWGVFACVAAVAAGCGDARKPGASARSAVSAGAGPAQLVADLRTGTAPVGSAPHGFVVSGATAFFAADDGSSGFELWRTQGVPGDPALVVDLRPGGGSALPASGRLEGIAWNGGILFAADDGSRGAELWFSDGTAAGTVLVKDIVPGTGSSSPRSFTASAGKVFFVADTPAEGAELWVTDGTEGGTQLVADIEPTYGVGSNPTGLTAVGTTLFFAATDSRGTELWKTDATSPTLATGIVKDLAVDSSDPTDLTALLGKLYFVASSGGPRTLFVSDGTAAGTMPVAAALAAGLTDPALLTTLGTTLYFAATAGASRDVWAWDVGAVTPGLSQKTSQNETPTALAAAGTNLFASLNRAASGRELYVWNGTAWGAMEVVAGPTGSSPFALTPVGSTLYFVATPPSGRALFRTNGTGSVQKIGPDLDVTELAALSGRALVAGDEGLSGTEPWMVDAGSVLASQLRNIRPDVASSDPQQLTAWNGMLYFTADDGVTGRELWVVDPSTMAATQVSDGIAIGAPSSLPADLVDAGGFLLFTAASPLEGRELWRSDGTDAGTLLVTNLRPGTASALQAPAFLTRLGSRVLFAADDGSGIGRELWATDGTAGGTVLVKDVLPGAASSLPTDLVAIGGNVWFVADDASVTNPFPKAYRTDGTAGNTVAVDSAAGDIIYDPAWFADFVGSTAFSAVHPLHGRTLVVFDPAHPGAPRVVDAFGQLDDSDPVGFVVHAGAGYFGAKDSTGLGYALWTTDGSSTGTSRVASIATLGGGRFTSPVSVGGKLFFVGNDDVNGDELWTSDGTAGGTALLADVLQGSAGAADGSVLFPLPARGHVLYAATDGASGRELWISNGTALGTRLLQDIRPGAASSNPAGFTAVGDLVFFTADDGVNGRELWFLDTSEAALDLTPPVPVCPALPLPFEATKPAGADPVFAISASDDRGGAVSVAFAPPPGSTFGFGVTPVLATATDASGNRAQCTLRIQVQDTTAPALTCPATLTLEATGAAGAVGTFTGSSAAIATDAVTVSPQVDYVPASGTTFPLGPGKSQGRTPVTVTATDSSFNTSTCSFDVLVHDTTAPAITCPPDVTVEASGPSGATASWSAATATDAVTAASSIVVAYDATPLSSVFPVGATSVHASARDEAGNVGRCAFSVRVRDTTPPTVSCPPSFSVEATSFTGADASFAATATDSVNLSPTITYDVVPGARPSGQTVTASFPYGISGVTAVASDGPNFSSPCVFSVTVQDTTPPVVTCPPTPVVSEATSLAGAMVTLRGTATATDVATASPAVAYAVGGANVADGGTLIPMGSFAAVATATDRGGNHATCPFTVTVVDTTAPALTCPADLHFEATSAAGAVATFAGAATATDAVTASPSVVYAPVSGTLFPLGAGKAPTTTPVVVTATDAAANTSACTFHVVVADTTPPVPSCPGALTVEATGPTGAEVLGWPAATGVDSVTDSAALAISYLPLPGVFAVGDTTVTATVRDEAMNAATCGFEIHVVDTTPPTIACPVVAPLEATGNGGAHVSFDAVAADTVTVVPLVTYDHQPGDGGEVFLVGTTVVTATATDHAGNQASCQLEVVVVDTTPPAIVCPADRRVTASGDVPVQFPAPTVYDAGTPAPAITSTRRSGDVFPLGSTVVRFTATDASGNAASCAMTVTVDPAPAKSGGGGGGCSTGGGGAATLLGLGAALLRRRRR